MSPVKWRCRPDAVPLPVQFGAEGAEVGGDGPAGDEVQLAAPPDAIDVQDDGSREAAVAAGQGEVMPGAVVDGRPAHVRRGDAVVAVLTHIDGQRAVFDLHVDVRRGVQVLPVGNDHALDGARPHPAAEGEVVRRPGNSGYSRR